MRRFVDGVDRGQATLFPGVPWGLYRQGHPVRVVDAFVDSLNLSRLGFEGVTPEATGRPSYQPSVLLKHYVYGYLNRVQSSRRLEREALRKGGHRGSCQNALQQTTDDYSIISSAVICIINGTVRPSTLAVLRLITNSNLEDCITGKSAGFSPLRIRPV